MKKFITKLIIFLPIFILLFLFSANIAEATNVYGSAWSEGVGWISFNSCNSPSNCSPGPGVPSHSVSLDPNTNKVSGTAWNQNIGVISFNPTDWGKCPMSDPGCDLNTFQNKWGVGGWARVTSVINGTSEKPNNGNWDGWISLGKIGTYNADIDFGTTVTLSDGGFSSLNMYTIDVDSNGYWWGSDVIGWIDLNPSTGFPYNHDEGGIFVADISKDLVLTGDQYEIAGNETSLTWVSQNNFYPISCQRTSSPSVGTSWDSTSYAVGGLTTETISNIELNHNNNDPSGAQFEFTIECTDGAIIQSAVWSVIVNQFKPQISFPYQCAVKTSTPPLNILNLEGADNPSCDVNASDSSNSNRFVGNTSASSLNDSGFNGLDTTYSMQCTNGLVNQASYTPPDIDVEVCAPFFEVYGDTRCGLTQQTEKYGDAFVKIGNDYISEVELTLNSFYGFNTEPVVISSSDSNLVFTPNTFTIGGGSQYNKIIGKYTLNEATYITNTNNGTDVISVQVTTNPNSKNTLVLNFCPAGSGFVKILPEYKPF